MYWQVGIIDLKEIIEMESADLLEQQTLAEIKHFCESGPIPAVAQHNISDRTFHIGVTSVDYLKANHELIRLGGEVWKLKQFKEWAEVQLDADRQAFAKMEYGTPGRRPVIIKVKDKVSQGWFLGFTGQVEGYTHAIIEWRDGTVNTEYLDCVTFYDWYTEELNQIDDGDCDEPTL